MPCTCLSRKRKERSPSVPPLQTNLTFQTKSPFDPVPEPTSPFLKLGRLTLLARIEKAFNPSQVEEKMDLPAPIRPESIVGCSSNPFPTHGNFAAETKESHLQESLGIYEVMPKHPNSAGVICRSGPSVPLKQLVLDILPGTRAHSLITPSDARKSQYAVVLETSQPLVQPPISPQPTPTFEKSNAQFHQGFHSSSPSMSSTHSTGSPPGNSLPQYATVLRPCLVGLLTPPLTPPPNVPLPPIPAAPESTAWPQRTHSLSMISRPSSAKRIMMDSTFPQGAHLDEMGTVTPRNRPRSKSSPLRSEMKRTSSHVPLPTDRQLRFLSSPKSFTSDSEITDDTNPTSEEAGETSIPIALFECTYSPPLPPPIIQTFAQQYQPSTRFSSELFYLQTRSKAPHNVFA